MSPLPNPTAKGNATRYIPVLLERVLPPSPGPPHAKRIGINTTLLRITGLILPNVVITQAQRLHDVILILLRLPHDRRLIRQTCQEPATCPSRCATPHRVPLLITVPCSNAWERFVATPGPQLDTWVALL